MNLATGIALALGTWVMLISLIQCSGLFIIALTDSSIHRENAADLRRALWWGLALLLALIMGASLLGPLQEMRALLFVLLPLAVTSAVGIAIAVRRGFIRALCKGPWRGRLPILLFLGLVSAYFALAALGPANNYDTGLYHLGAIKYAAEYGVVPGLANLYFPFGYANSQFAVAAWLSNGPFGIEGFRLANGLVILLATMDLLIRLRSDRPRSLGTNVLLVGLLASAFPLIAIADFWVTSPTADSTMLILTVVATAYLADYWQRRRSQDAAIAVLTTLVMLTTRPTMAVFAVILWVSVLTMGIQRAKTRTPGARFTVRLLVLVGITAASLGALTLARDRLLSGWIGYPLSLLPLDVPWRAEDPTGVREATLAAARDASAADQWLVANSWDWVQPWMQDRLALWETYFVALWLALGVGLLIASACLRMRRARLALLVLWLPSVSALIAWFAFSPPSYRFIWGPLAIFAVAPMASALTFASDTPTRSSRALKSRVPLVTAGVIVIGLVGFSAAFRTDYISMTTRQAWDLGPLQFTFVVSPQPEVVTYDVETPGGVVLKVPEQGDQCWDAYPLCTPTPWNDLQYRGSSIADGFLP